MELRSQFICIQELEAHKKRFTTADDGELYLPKVDTAT
jgi:hypothetical protein